jgi:hypothetical protein
MRRPPSGKFWPLTTLLFKCSKFTIATPPMVKFAAVSAKHFPLCHQWRVPPVFSARVGGGAGRGHLGRVLAVGGWFASTRGAQGFARFGPRHQFRIDALARGEPEPFHESPHVVHNSPLPVPTSPTALLPQGNSVLTFLHRPHAHRAIFRSLRFRL